MQDDDRFLQLLKAHDGEMRVYVTSRGGVIQEVKLTKDKTSTVRGKVFYGTGKCLQPCILV